MSVMEPEFPSEDFLFFALWVVVQERKVNPKASFGLDMPVLGARLRGRTATQRSKKGSENVLGWVLEKGFSEGF